ncbi:AfsR/SARP family transcriptional regulator [Fodinicola feengrottensis]|uniref:AfsR/SARP family transcriptional regulator n=1 Tax=Fodinicola feengrottensis TaxID=435914 RepID=UPI0024431CC2|nr:BTAD domain-containing putative transcriptional regulator [Fodinicola feengrottensis]
MVAHQEIEFGVLGCVEAWSGPRRLELGPPKQRLVLAVLLLEANRVISTERLVDLSWPQDPPASARTAIHGRISRLRATIAAADGLAHGVALVSEGSGYRLNIDPELVDAHRFVATLGQAREAATDEIAVGLYDRALRLWRGTALDGAVSSDVRLRLCGNLEEARLLALEDRADALLRLGLHRSLIDGLTSLLEAHPMRERMASQLVLTLYRSGQAGHALQVCQRVRAKLRDELGIDPGPALSELELAVLRNDESLLAPADVRLSVGTANATSETTPRPARQLPAAPTGFVGREDALAHLDAALADDTVRISSIAGSGGIGKTWLALNWAHRHADQYPDGQLFVDLRGFSPDTAPMDPATAVRGFLDALGVGPDRIPIDPHARAAMFRDLVADKRMLMVLDNATDSGQIVPLLPGGQTCTVVVTSRTRLTGLITRHAAQHVPLDALSETEAGALLTNRLGECRVAAEPAAAEQLIELCGGFPLALSIIAAHAQVRPRLPLAVLADELRDLGLDALADDDPTASLPAVLSWSHRALTPPQRTTFALVGIAPGPDIGLAAAASLMHHDPSDTRKLLGGLEQASLITQSADGRYRMHDLIRHYASDIAKLLPEERRISALRRLCDFYLHTAHNADRQLNPHREPISLTQPVPGTRAYSPPDDQSALTWFDSEYRCLLATRETAISHEWHQCVWGLTWTVEPFLRRRGQLRDRLAIWQTGLAAALHLANPTAHILAHRLLGRAHADLGEHDEAIDHLHQTLALAEQHQDDTNQAHTHRTGPLPPRG